MYLVISKIYINISEHEYVPKHEIISENEKLSLIKEYNLKNIFDLSCISFQDLKLCL